ncbi:type II toxin-antitoxin system RelE/ParE family toxin [Mycoplana sp. MJR14]|uniref:type II toxin-antitoxin system RelE/ParE family toxin n=1 Tax=Mycoplana sp. MJR14 TaxID=3032583 RepID=UPI000DD985CA|nr:type II toxin-antitoxin system RelE/ParE family toxin [Mycoplana sp. MJR14]MDF1632066.1 type II toxin-antitoxin system RelE/ParE family toxin [Mycoplana sp. MJR14]
MSYDVKFHPDFVPEWKELEMGLKELVGEVLDHLEDDGPFLGRPEVDRLSGSGHTNMKEIRVTFVKQVWRFAFAFDPDQAAIVLCGGEKQGKNQKLFYKQLISKADQRFDSWLKDKKVEQ